MIHDELVLQLVCSIANVRHSMCVRTLAKNKYIYMIICIALAVACCDALVMCYVCI